MKLTKTHRQLVHDKFGGKCAYCGCDLPERWHADHLEPVVRTQKGNADHPDRHNIENMMPACPQCNISKGRQDLEGWRAWLQGHVKSLNKFSAIYRLSKSYGLIVETEKPVKFYFEQA